MEKGEEIGDLRTSSFDATWQLGRLPTDKSHPAAKQAEEHLTSPRQRRH